MFHGCLPFAMEKTCEKLESQNARTEMRLVTSVGARAISDFSWRSDARTQSRFRPNANAASPTRPRGHFAQVPVN